MSDITIETLKSLYEAARSARSQAQDALDSADEVMDMLADAVRAATPTPAPTPAPIPVTESYWQRGFNDGAAGRPECPPDGLQQQYGYRNGYYCGKAQRRSLCHTTAPAPSSPAGFWLEWATTNTARLLRTNLIRATTTAPETKSIRTN